MHAHFQKASSYTEGKYLPVGEASMQVLSWIPTGFSIYEADETWNPWLLQQLETTFEQWLVSWYQNVQHWFELEKHGLPINFNVLLFGVQIYHKEPFKGHLQGESL